MKSYKISHEDEHLFHITHPDGSTFAVAKKAVGPGLVKRIQAFAQGGEVQDPALDVGNVAGVLGAAPATGAPASLQAPPPAPEPVAAVPQAAPAATQPVPIPGMAEQVSGLKGMAGAQVSLGKDQQAALKDYQTKMDASAAEFGARRAAIDADQAKLVQGLTEGTIDPNRYWNNKTTGQKISAGLGLILGGIGAGLTHGPNAALEVMNKAIDNDIESQKADLGKKNTLLQMNLHKYQNLDAAEAATKLQYNTYLQTRLQSAAAKAGATQAGAQLQMQLGTLKQQSEALKQTLADQRTQAQSIGATGAGEGGLPAGSPSDAQLLMRDPKYRGVRVVVGGRAYQANDASSAGTLRSAETLAKPIMDAIGKLNDLAKDSETRVPGTAKYNQAQALLGDLATKMPMFAGNTVGVKRITHEEVEAQRQRLQDPTKFSQMLGGLKNEEFISSFMSELEGLRANHLLGYKGAPDLGFKPISSGKLPRN